jgi:hypothetical protein
MNANASPALHDEFTYTMPKGLHVGLMIASACWFSVDGIAIAPIGFLFALVTVAQKYEASYVASIRTGWRVLAQCGAIGTASYLLLAFQVGIARTGIELGIFAPLARLLG